MVIKIPDTSPIIKVYLDYARLCQSIIGVALPVIAVAVLNVSLIYFLRKRDILPRIVGDNRFVEMGAFQRQERKVRVGFDRLKPKLYTSFIKSVYNQSF
jgi:hypothetical protein